MAEFVPVQKDPAPPNIKGNIEKDLNDSKVIKFERYVQKEFIDELNKSHVLDLERRVQNKIIPLLGGTKVFAQARGLQKAAQQTLNPPPAPPSNAPPPVYQPVDINGFYKVTGPNELTFYVTTPWPGFSIGNGWTGIGILGLSGNIQVSGSNNAPGSVIVTSLTSES